MITVNEALNLLNEYANREFSGYPKAVCPNFFCDIMELLRHLSTENELKGRIIREIKSGQTGVGALRLALIRARELEAENEQLRARVDELEGTLRDYAPEGLKSLEEDE